MAVRNPPSFLQNITLIASGHTAQNDRLSLGAAFAPGAAVLSGRSGILPGPANGRGEVSLLSNTLARVQPFRAVIQGTRSSLQGQYLVINDAAADLTIGAMAAGVSRKDLLIANVRDSAFAPDTLDDAALQVVPGTPAASNPAEPALGGVNLGNYLILGVFNVPPTGGTVTFTPRTDLGTVSAGGVLPAGTSDTALPLYDGQYRDHPSLGLQVGRGGAWWPATPQLPRIDLRITTQQLFGGNYLIPWQAVITEQTSPPLVSNANEWFGFEAANRRILVKRAGLYFFDLEVTTNDGTSSQYVKLVKTPTINVQGPLIAQDGGKANYGLNRIGAAERLSAGEYIAAALSTSQSAREDLPASGLRTHLAITRLGD